MIGSLELVMCGDGGLWIEGEVKGRPGGLG